MIRAFKKFTIGTTNTPQPLVGTTLTAAVGPVNKPYDREFGSGLLTLPVADSSMFRTKDYLNLGNLSGASGEPDLRFIVSSVPNGTSVVVQVTDGFQTVYPSGTFVRLSVSVNSTYVQTIAGNAGTIYIGTSDAMVVSTLALVISQLAPVAGGQPTEFHDGRYGLQNADNAGNYWITGTGGDGYLPSFGAV